MRVPSNASISLMAIVAMAASVQALGSVIIGEAKFNIANLCGVRTAKSGLYTYDVDVCGAKVPQCGGSNCQFREQQVRMSAVAFHALLL